MVDYGRDKQIKMNILIELAHPRHYHQFKAVRDIMTQRGNKVILAATDRKLLIELLQESSEEFVLFKHTTSGSIIRKTFAYLKRLAYFKRVLDENLIDVLISKASISTFFGKLVRPGLKTVIFPDSEVVQLMNNFVRYFADLILLPRIFPLAWTSPKVIRVNGTCENCYLDPRYFQPEILDPTKYGYQENEKYAFFRFVAWKAHHDIGQYGFNSKERIEIVQLFIEHGYTPLISFEADPDEELKKYLNPFPKNKVMSVLTMCEYFVSDSQSMSAEACLLGLKSFRYNSWVKNDMSNFKYFNRKKLILNYDSYPDLYRDLTDSLNGRMDFFQPIASYWDSCDDINMVICNSIEQRFGSKK